MDIDKINQKVKDVAQTAEGLFQVAKHKIKTSEKESPSEDSPSQSKTKTSDFDWSPLLEMADHFVGDYIKQHLGFHSQIDVKIKRWPHFKGNIPQYESSGASGLDVRAQLSEPMVIPPRKRVLVPTGLSLEVPQEYEIQARPRSGLALKKGLSLPNSPGTIDADYRGEIKIIMINLGEETVTIEDQERIAQLVICPVVKARFKLTEDLSDTSRGSGGFGSTGSR